MMLILSCGSLLSSNTDKALLLQTSGNIKTSDIIGVYVYNTGIGKGIGARSCWITVTVEDFYGNTVTSSPIKVRFYNWNWQIK